MDLRNTLKNSFLFVFIIFFISIILTFYSSDLSHWESKKSLAQIESFFTDEIGIEEDVVRIKDKNGYPRGSGFRIGGNYPYVNYFITNAHVINHSKEGGLLETFSRGKNGELGVEKTFQFEVVDFSKEKDLALIYVKSEPPKLIDTGVNSLTIASTNLPKGKLVRFCGCYQGGVPRTYQKSRVIRTGYSLEGIDDSIKVSVSEAISTRVEVKIVDLPGFSGCPVVTDDNKREVGGVIFSNLFGVTQLFIEVKDLRSFLKDIGYGFLVEEK